ncbi:MAG: zinc ribbon domain-containing protein [Muribaculaceae bacterium]|nr:zinc ribbon domain-containing protein [Muribaculaceae bacterium]
MRCNNCGWVNADESAICVKCGNPLASANRPQYQPNVGMAQPAYDQSVPKPTERFDSREPRPTVLNVPGCAHEPKPTVVNIPNMHAESGNPAATSGADNCTSCGYPMLPNSSKCPNCGAPRQRLTIRPNMKGANHKQSGFKLVMLPEEEETFEPVELAFVQENVILNRANTDKGNMTITSREQALISRNGDKWFIDNRSDLGTTYIQVNSPIELHDGDVIVLGDRRFKFNAPKD